jgi:hypothetical protein
VGSAESRFLFPTRPPFEQSISSCFPEYPITE